MVAGAGPVGLSLATGLSYHGISCLVVEKEVSLSRHSRAPGILPRTLAIFDTWGVLDPMLEEGTLMRHPRLWPVGGSEPLFAVSFDPIAGLTPYPGVLILPQDRTEALLADQLQRTRDGAEIRFGHALTGFEQDADGVSVEIAADGRSYRVRCHYLAGCDGAHSTVREALGWELEGITYPARVTLADVELPDERNDLPWPRATLGPEVLAAVKIGPRLWRIIAPTPEDTDEEESLSHETLTRQVERLFGTGPFDPVWSSAFRIHCRNSPGFRRGRVLLAGDAAHINSPAGGQGMNSGIQDAHNLAWKLARALRGGHQEALLASYEEERRPVVLTNIDRYTDLLTRFVLLGSPFTRNVLAAAAKLALALPPVRDRILRRAAMLDYRYRDSSLLPATSGVRWRRLLRRDRLGCQVPDPWLVRPDGTRLRLHELFGPQACVLWLQPGAIAGRAGARRSRRDEAPARDATADGRDLEEAMQDLPDVRLVRVLCGGGGGTGTASRSSTRGVAGSAGAAARAAGVAGSSSRVAGDRGTAVAGCGSHVPLLDDRGVLSRFFRAHRSTVVLVRPDGHVGWVGVEPTAAETQRNVAAALGLAVP